MEDELPLAAVGAGFETLLDSGTSPPGQEWCEEKPNPCLVPFQDTGTGGRMRHEEIRAAMVESGVGCIRDPGRGKTRNPVS